MSSKINPPNPLAVDLNNQIKQENQCVYNLLSEKGKVFFFPKGILSQSAEAKEKAYKYNATIGIATESDKPLVFPSISKFFNEELLSDADIFNYTSSYGNQQLRSLWQKRIVELTPSLEGADISLPIVTCGLTHGLSIVAEMFFNPGDVVLLPDQIWGNYKLIFSVKNDIKIQSYNFFKNDKFDFESFKKAVENQLKIQSENQSQTSSRSVKIFLNFPNNPTGYSLYNSEANEIVDYLHSVAEQGDNVLVILDDAYFGLYYEEEVYPESLFGLLSNCHKNLLVIKTCGITKEFFAWGLRVGFLTYGIKGGTTGLYESLEKKTGGAIRGNISNLSTSAQNIAVKVLENQEECEKDFEKNYGVLKTRGQEVKRVLSTKDYSSQFVPYPFNAGYFMLVKLREGLDAEQVRIKLLNEKGIGVISTSARDIRIAFSCLLVEQIGEVFDSLFEVCETF